MFKTSSEKKIFTILFVVESFKGFGWNNVGPASQTVDKHYFPVGPMYRVIQVMAFQGTKRQRTHMAVRSNTGQSPNSVSMLGQRRIRSACSGVRKTAAQHST